MKNNLTVLSSLMSLLFCWGLLLCSCNRVSHDDNGIKKALINLDKTLSMRQEIDAMKETRISDIKSKLSHNPQGRALYQIYDDLFYEYYKYNQDSAVVYASKKMQYADQVQETDLILDASFDMVERYVLSGMYYSAMNVIERIDTSAEMTLWQRHHYYLAKQSIYEGLAQTCRDPVLKQEYQDISRRFRTLRYESSEKNWLSYVYASADIYTEQGEIEKTQELLTNVLSKNQLSNQDKGILNYLLANSYLQSGDREKATLHFALSADYDLREPLKEYRSLGILATHMFENGEIDRAYRYITRAFEDAVSVNSRPSLDYITDALPVITTAYEQLIRTKNRRMFILLLALALVVIALICAMAILFRNRKRINEANKKIRQNAIELKQINARLERYIARLKDANAVKESYLGRYMDLFSDHINSLERYRSQLRIVAKNRDYSEILSALKSDDFIESELTQFYNGFDATFLGLYPNFIQDLNHLLKPDCTVAVPSKDDTLTTELRVFALIRLGITDSFKIARFLRKSTSTIYNYRVKLRNSALSNREDFEKAVMSIGKPV